MADYPLWYQKRWQGKTLPGHEPMHTLSIFKPMLVTRDAQGQAYVNIRSNFVDILTAHDLEPEELAQRSQQVADLIANGNKAEALEIYGRRFLEVLQPVTGSNLADAEVRHFENDVVASIPIKGMNLSHLTPMHLGKDGWEPGNFGSILGDKSNRSVEGTQFWSGINKLDQSLSDTDGGLLESAARKTLRSGSEPTLLGIIEHHKIADKLRNCDDKTTNYLEYFKKNPEILAELETLQEKAGITSFSVAGHGATGLFYKASRANGEPLVLALRNAQNPRAVLPHNIQPVYTKQFDGLYVEILPTLNLEKLTDQKMFETKAAIDAYHTDGIGFHAGDINNRNLGISEHSGTCYYLDGNGINTGLVKDLPPVNLEHHADWIRPDGTWQQYEDFKELHAQFDSPLHQAGGKLKTPPPKEPKVAPKTPAPEIPPARAKPLPSASPANAAEDIAHLPSTPPANIVEDVLHLPPTAPATAIESVAEKALHTPPPSSSVAKLGEIEQAVEKSAKFGLKNPYVAIGAVVLAGAAIAIGVNMNRKKESKPNINSEVPGGFAERIRLEREQKGAVQAYTR